MNTDQERLLRLEIAELKRHRLVTAQAALDEMDLRVNAAMATIRQLKNRLVALRKHVTKQQISELDQIIAELPVKI